MTLNCPHQNEGQLSKSPKRNISRAQFGLEHPQLDKTTQTSVRDETAHRNTTTSYMGGNSAGDLGDDPVPSLTPTPTDEPDPTPPPTEEPTDKPTPTKDPGDKPTAAPADPEGDLADTGNSTPVGLIAGIAAALAAAGAALTWWIRRRNGQVCGGNPGTVGSCSRVAARLGEIWEMIFPQWHTEAAPGHSTPSL